MRVHSVKRTPLPQKQTPRTFNVTLSEGEVDLLLGVLAEVGGDPIRSPRKYAARMLNKLMKVSGYGYAQTDAWRLRDENYSGSIIFRNYDGTAAPGFSAPEPALAVADPFARNYVTSLEIAAAARSALDLPPDAEILVMGLD